MALRDFPLPGIHFFISGNPFTGSFKGLNYKVIPVKADEEKDIDSHLTVSVWYGMLCSDLSEIQAVAEFPLDIDGLAQAEAWLAEQYAAMPA